MTDPMAQRQPWWKRPVAWLLPIVALAGYGVVVIVRPEPPDPADVERPPGESGRFLDPAVMRYFDVNGVKTPVRDDEAHSYRLFPGRHQLYQSAPKLFDFEPMTFEIDGGIALHALPHYAPSSCGLE